MRYALQWSVRGYGCCGVESRTNIITVMALPRLAPTGVPERAAKRNSDARGHAVSTRTVEACVIIDRSRICHLPCGAAVSALETCFLLARADGEVRRRLEVQGLSLNDLAALSLLAETPNRTRRRQDLADSLGMTPSGVTRLLTPLEKLGYVTRVADPRDARLALVVLTDAGEERTRDAVAEAEERAMGLFDHAFGTDQQETLDTLLAALIPFK